MLKKTLIVALVLSFAALVPPTARVASIDPDQTRMGMMLDSITGNSDEVREEFHQTYPLSPTGRVTVDNINGEVRIGVWDRNEVEVNAVKRANSRERLAEAQIEVLASADSVRIKTKYPEREQNFDEGEKGRLNSWASIDYRLMVPRTARLESIDLINGALDIEGVEGDVKASAVNGRLSARGLTGEARLSTVNGNLDAVFTRLQDIKPISLSSVNGNVSLVIPSNSNAVVRASTVHGAITNDFGLEVHDGDYVGHELFGQIGTGGPRVKLGNVNGRIEIKRSQDGAQLSPATSLLSKSSAKEDVDVGDFDFSQLNTDARKIAEEARREALASIDKAQIERKAEAKKEVDQALRDAEQEIRQAQAEVQRETRRELRDRFRSEGRGNGTGNGEGRGSDRFTGRESKTFAVTGTPTVNVVSNDGVVVVHGWDKPQVMYTAATQASGEEELKQTAVKAEQEGSAISIIAGDENSDESVNLEVYLPRSVSLHVSTNDGRLSVEGVSGDVTLRTGDGAIDVSNVHGTLKLNTGDGRIKVSAFDGGLDARTGDGPIMLDGKFTSLAARTGSGTVSLSVPADSNFIIETNAEDLTSEGLNVSEDLSPSRRVKRWKVGQGGLVFVINTDEGKVILRPR